MMLAAHANLTRKHPDSHFSNIPKKICKIESGNVVKLTSIGPSSIQKLQPIHTLPGPSRPPSQPLYRSENQLKLLKAHTSVKNSNLGNIQTVNKINKNKLKPVGKIHPISGISKAGLDIRKGYIDLKKIE